MADPSPASSSRATVLVVDDESSVAKLCVTILKQGGFDTLSTDGSSEALKICKEHPGKIDLLLTDLVLPPPAFQLASSSNEYPHVHGHDLALRAMHLREGLRILMMSGNPEKELANYGIKRGSFPFIQKPLDVDTFLQTVRNVLQAPPPTLTEDASKAAGGDVEWFD